MENIRNLRKANLEDAEIQKEMLYNDGELALFNNIQDLNAILPCQLEVFAIVLVLKGKASVSINGTHYEALPNDLYIGTPNNIVPPIMSAASCRWPTTRGTSNYFSKRTPYAPCNPRRPGPSANTTNCFAPRHNNPRLPKRR